MKYLLILLALMVIVGCDSETINPMGVVDPVTVVLELDRSKAYDTEVFCSGVLVALLKDAGECDTISVSNGSELKAQIHYPSSIGYKTIIAYEGLVWELP